MTTITAVCYHYLSRTDEFKRIWGHDFELFKKHLAFFQSQYMIINPQDLLDEKFEAGKEYLLLTFDDGLLEHKKIADFLVSQNIKAVFAVPTCIFNGELLNPQIIHFGCAYYGIRKFYDFLIQEIKDQFPQHQSLMASDPAKEDVMALHKKIKNLIKRDLDFPTGRKILLSILEKHLKKDFPDIVQRVHLSKADLLTMVGQGQLIASHSYSHPVVSSIINQPEIFNTEVVQSKKTLEGSIGQSVDIFAYPFGEAPDVVADQSKIVQAGYKQILTTFQENTVFDQLKIGRYCSQSQDQEAELTKHLWKYTVK